MIDRYSPLSRAMSLRQMMDRLLEDAFIVPGGQQQQDGGTSSLAVNAYEEGDNFVVEAQLPGMRPEDIDVSIEHGTLTIRGEFQNEDERQDRNYVIREYRRGSFVRSLRLPETVDPDAADAKFEDGVLRLVFPKSERAKPRRISVGGNGHQRAQSRMTEGKAGTQATGSQSTGTQGQAGQQSQPKSADRGSASPQSERGQAAAASGPNTGAQTSAQSGARSS